VCKSNPVCSAWTLAIQAPPKCAVALPGVAPSHMCSLCSIPPTYALSLPSLPNQKKAGRAEKRSAERETKSERALPPLLEHRCMSSILALLQAMASGATSAGVTSAAAACHAAATASHGERHNISTSGVVGTHTRPSVARLPLPATASCTTCRQRERRRRHRSAQSCVSRGCRCQPRRALPGCLSPTAGVMSVPAGAVSRKLPMGAAPQSTAGFAHC